MADQKVPEGLGGWLILVGLGIVISPLIMLVTLIPLYSGILTDGTWEILTTPGSDAYHPLWGPFLILEILVNALIVLGWLVLGFFFFAKHRFFPKLFICMVLFRLAFFVIDTILIGIVAPTQDGIDGESLEEIGRSLVHALIWIPYMLISKRVKATFVR